MALKKYRIKVPAEVSGGRLDHVLAGLLPAAMGEPISKGKVRKLILAGAIYVNRARVRIASKPVYKDAVIEAAIDMAKLEGPDRGPSVKIFELTAESVRFEDEHLLVVSKPEGLPTQPTIDDARANLYASVQKYLGSDGVKGYAGLHHRLDSDTSGLVLFTKTKEANPGVAKLFAEHGIRKIYWALARRPSGGLKEEWVVKNFLGKLPGPKKPSKYGAVRSGGDHAETEFKLVDSVGDRVLVQAFPRTGRTHQIRVHLSEMGMPISGDRLYGAADPGARLMLHARELEFKHPISGAPIRVVDEPPASFTSRLQALRNPDPRPR